jgi:hypothetical protein
MKFDQIKELSEEQFRRLIGVKKNFEKNVGYFERSRCKEEG